MAPRPHRRSGDLGGLAIGYGLSQPYKGILLLQYYGSVMKKCPNQLTDNLLLFFFKNDLFFLK